MVIYVVVYRTIVSKYVGIISKIFLSSLKVATATVCDIICIKNIPIVTQSRLEQQCGGEGGDITWGTTLVFTPGDLCCHIVESRELGGEDQICQLKAESGVNRLSAPLN